MFNRKLVCLSILTIFFLSWGAARFGAGPHKALLSESTFPDGMKTTIVPQATQSELIPVTGNQGSGWGTLLIYGLIELAALTLILALLDAANQSTALYGRRKTSQEDDPKR